MNAQKVIANYYMTWHASGLDYFRRQIVLYIETLEIEHIEIV